MSTARYMEIADTISRYPWVSFGVIARMYHIAPATVSIIATMRRNGEI